MGPSSQQFQQPTQANVHQHDHQRLGNSYTEHQTREFINGVRAFNLNFSFQCLLNSIQILRPAIHPGLLSQRQPKVKHKVRMVNTSLVLARLAVQVLLPKIQSRPPSLLTLRAQIHNSSSSQHRLTCTNTAIRD
jgi:hypothetical protein